MVELSIEKVRLGIMPLLLPLRCVIFLRKKLSASSIVLCIPSKVTAVNICLFFFYYSTYHISFLFGAPKCESWLAKVKPNDQIVLFPSPRQLD